MLSIIVILSQFIYQTNLARNMNVFDNVRSLKDPYLMGDVFTAKGKELTLLTITPTVCFGLLNKNGFLRMAKFRGISDILEQGFTPVQEYIEKSNEIKDWGLYAPRKLNDGTWGAISRLAFTTSININFDEAVSYETRYCFGHNSVLPSYHTALYWLAQFKNKNSLPIGNCAYRGRLGSEPITDTTATEKYYQDLHALKYEQMLIDGRDIHGVANEVMISLLVDLLVNGGANV